MDNMRCHQCYKTFSGRFSLRRHMRTKHSQTEARTPRETHGAPGHMGHNVHNCAQCAHFRAQCAHFRAQCAHFGAPQGSPPRAPEAPQGSPSRGPNDTKEANLSHLQHFDNTASAEIKPMILQHPFTMMITGPTACGKTTFVKDLLLHHTTRIDPKIQRIVWLYKRWQPLYTLIQRTVFPKVEFVQGIPVDLEDDDFFDTRLRNLLILDDLFSETGKDKRITDLFTEGSHHRSLSVISINQNLFSNKDPTQRRNCHYLVLFNNPVDRQTMMTLARQMYPGNTEKFQKAFSKATKNPYGYLLVDLKPFTAEEGRLKYALDWPDKNQDRSPLTNQIQEPSQKTIKGDNSWDSNHFSVDNQTIRIDQDIAMAEKGQACDDCGLLFDTAHDVQRHVKSGWCPENNEPPAKKVKKEVDIIKEDVEENEGYKKLWKLAKECNKGRFSKLYDQYVKDGENEDEATDMATQRIQPYDEKSFFDRYQWLLDVFMLPLKTNPTHRAIVEQIENLRSNGISLTSAVKRVLKTSKNNFEELFETGDNESEDDTDSEDSE